MSEAVEALVIGAGPAGLMAAEILSQSGRRVVVVEAMPTPAEVRDAYVENLLTRLASPHAWSPAYAEGAR